MNIKIRLIVMNFLQYAVWGAWLISLGAYLGGGLKFSGVQIGSFFATMGIASLFMPGVMGIIADRWIPAQKLLGLARKHGIVIVAGTLERAGKRLHMSAFVAYPDGRLLVQRKHRLTPTELGAGLTPGPEKRMVFSVDGVKCAICICADSGIENLYNKLADQGVQLSLHPTAGGGGRKFMKHAADLDDPRKLKSYLRDMEKVCFMGGAIKQCLQHHMCMIACNLSGDDGVGNYHPGHAAIVDSRGKTVGLIPGEYVVEFLRPQLIHGEVVVRKPREA